VLADGANALAQMTAIMLAGDPNFRPPTVHGITKKLADGSLFHPVNLGKVNMQFRMGVFADLTILGPVGKVIENKGPTEDEVTLELARNNEPLRRALLIYRALKHDWGNLW
jgi:hypothetical protein